MQAYITMSGRLLGILEGEGEFVCDEPVLQFDIPYCTDINMIDVVFDEQGNPIDVKLKENQFDVTDEEGNIIPHEPIDEEKAAMAEAIIDMENRISQLEAMLNA